MNILFTCAGRRNYLLQYFREALDHGDRIMAADMQITAPAMIAADKAFVVPDIYCEEYVGIILKICREEQIQALFSLNDLELPILASEKKRFEEIGTKIIVSDQKVIDICFDKYKTALFGEQTGINIPRTYMTLYHAHNDLNNYTLKFPVVIKPRWGSASIGIEFPETLMELELAYNLVCLKISRSSLYQASKENLKEAVIIQEKIAGTEFGLDILNDFSGRPVQVYVKEKLAMRAGETDKAILRHIPDLEELGFYIGEKLGHIGNLDCDIFESNGKYYLLEMNPRFGGGYPFSHISGANYPAAICAWLKDCIYDFGSIKQIFDQPFAKCDTLIKVLI